LQDRREVPTATSTSGNPSACRGDRAEMITNTHQNGLWRAPRALIAWRAFSVREAAPLTAGNAAPRSFSFCLGSALLSWSRFQCRVLTKSILGSYETSAGVHATRDGERAVRKIQKSRNEKSRFSKSKNLKNRKLENRMNRKRKRKARSFDQWLSFNSAFLVAVEAFGFRVRRGSRKEAGHEGLSMLLPDVVARPSFLSISYDSQRAEGFPLHFAGVVWLKWKRSRLATHAVRHGEVARRTPPYGPYMAAHRCTCRTSTPPYLKGGA